MADDFDFDPAPLQALIDGIEGTGAPPHLVERLRELVRKEAETREFLALMQMEVSRDITAMIANTYRLPPALLAPPEPEARGETVEETLTRPRPAWSAVASAPYLANVLQPRWGPSPIEPLVPLLLEIESDREELERQIRIRLIRPDLDRFPTSPSEPDHGR